VGTALVWVKLAELAVEAVFVVSKKDEAVYILINVDLNPAF
jgi:hypothetical protein